MHRSSHCTAGHDKVSPAERSSSATRPRWNSIRSIVASSASVHRPVCCGRYQQHGSRDMLPGRMGEMKKAENHRCDNGKMSSSSKQVHGDMLSKSGPFLDPSLVVNFNLQLQTEIFISFSQAHSSAFPTFLSTSPRSPLSTDTFRSVRCLTMSCISSTHSGGGHNRGCQSVGEEEGK